MNLAQDNGEWIPLQIKVFTCWVSSHLNKKETIAIVNDITKDLSTGVALVKLAQILTKKEAPRRWSHFPKRSIEMVQNCDLAIEMFTKDGVDLTGISGKDIYDSKEKLILGLIWTLISHYSIRKSINNKDLYRANSTPTKSCGQHQKSKDNKEALLHWAFDRTLNYPNIKKFSPYELAMCALLDSFVPDQINYHNLDPNDSMNNAKLAVNVMHELGIPVYLDPTEYHDIAKVDTKALLTQLAITKVRLEHFSNDQKTNKNSFDYSLSNEEEEEEEELVADGVVADEIVDDVDSYSEYSEFDQETNFHAERRTADINEFYAYHVDDDNSMFSGRKFGLTLSINENEYNNGEKMNPNNNEIVFGRDLSLALTLVNDGNSFLNPAGLKLDITKADIKNDVNQQFTFGTNEWNTVIDSVARKGMVWDVANCDNENPPAGTQFYLFPFHGRHNQHFVYKEKMIYAQQNGMVVTYVGGSEPLVMMPPNPALRSRQIFKIQIF